MRAKHTHEQYLLSLIDRGIKYIPLSIYKGSKTYLPHKCLCGHIWQAKPEHILSGRSCNACSKKHKFKTHEQYEEELLRKEINYFPVERYIRDNEKIIHECIQGHQWYARPNDILRGSGCPKCSNTSFKRDEPAILYFIKLTCDLYKLGVTNKSVHKRFKTEPIKPLQIIWEIPFSRGKDAEEKEKQLKVEYNEFRVNTSILNRGNTEIFSTIIPKPES